MESGRAECEQEEAESDEGYDYDQRRALHAHAIVYGTLYSTGENVNAQSIRYATESKQ